MTTFKEYRKKAKSKIPSIETSFGSHSKKKKKVPSIETSFGSHSKKKSIREDVEDPFKAAHKHHELTNAQDAEAHLHIAPLHSDKLSADETEAVHNYTDNSTPLNGMLHGHDKGHPENKSTPRLKDHAGQLDSALEKHKTTADMDVFTGIKFSPSKHFRRENGKVPTSKQMHMPAYTSTSTSLGIAKTFSEHTSHPNDDRHGVDSEDDEKRHVLKIHVPAGTHAMSLMKHSFVAGEKEIMLHRGHTIEVHHKPEQISHDTYLWHAKIISHNKADLSKEAE